MKDYVLAPLDKNESDAELALQLLAAFLLPRVEEATSSNVVNKSVESIFTQVRDEIG